MPHFTGRSTDSIAILQYLYLDRPKQCMFLLEQVLRDHTNIDLWYRVAFVWREQVLHVPGGSVEALRFEVCRCPHALTVIPLVMTDANRKYLHANFIILDRDEATMELFEPFGQMPVVYGRSEPLDDALRMVVRRIFSGARRPLLVRPRLDDGPGLQARQELEESMRRDDPELPPGFCLAWSALYAKIRLASPPEQRSLIPQKMLQMAHDRTSHASMTSFIRAFAQMLVETAKPTMKNEKNKKQ